MNRSLLLLLAALPALAAATTFEERPFATRATREQLLERAARATPEAYPDADTVILHDGEHVLYDASGRYLEASESCVKVLTERGRRDTRSQSFWYTARYSRPIRFIVAEILRPDGSATPLDTAVLVNERTDRSGMGSNIYDPMDKIVELTVPDLQIGDSLHIVVERETFKSRAENSWSDWVLFEDTSPILYSVYEVWSPDARPLKSIQLRDPVGKGPLYTTAPAPSGNATLHRWESSDMPQVFPEPDMPRLYTCVERLLVSTESDWRDLSRWYDRLCQPRLDAVNDAMRAKVAELVAGCADDSARIRAIFDFVSQQIRYMGITDEDVSPGYEPHDVSLTFDNRYGVCRDKAALLAAMLRLAGIKAHPTLFSVGTRKDPDVPQPFFNHAIVAVDRGEGEGAARYLLMDPTNEKSRDLFPAYLYNYDYLVASPEGETLLNAGPAPVAENLVRIRTTGSLDADRSLVLETRVSFDGVNDAIYRNHFAQQKPEERERYFEKVLRDRLPGAELLVATIVPDDIGNTDLPLEATLRYRVPDAPVDGEGAWLLRLPWLSPALGFSPRVLGRTGLDKRRFPLELLPTCGEEETVEIRLSDAGISAPLSLPAPVHIHSGALDFAHEASFSDGVLRASRHTHLLAAQVETADYAALRSDLHDQEAAARRQAVFAPGTAAAPAERRRNNAPLAPPAPDAEILLRDIAYVLDSEHAWTRTDTTRTRILTYAAVKDRSELTFDYNPVWEKVEIVSATVTAPDGTVQSASEKEINLLDASWVAGAPRYPAAKTLVVSLPGVQEGSVVETVVRRTCWDRPWFAFAHTFRGSDPVLECTLTLSMPEDAAFALCLHENDHAHPATIGSENGRTVYSWRFIDLPALQPENHLPPSWLRVPAVQCSSRSGYAPFLADLQSRVRALVDGPAASVARLKGAELARAAISDGSERSSDDLRIEAVRAIRDFVATSIRPAGPGFLDLPSASALTAPDTTLSDGYGHQADRVLLLMALLEGAGIADYELVPVCSYSSESPDILRPLLDIPMSGAFGKLLLRVPVARYPLHEPFALAIPHGDDNPPSFAFWLGDTDQYALLSATPSEDSLTLLPDATFGSVKTDRPTIAGSSMLVNLHADGSATVRNEVANIGSNYASFHKTYAEMRPEDRRRHHLELVGSLARGAVPNGELQTKFDMGVRAFGADIADYAVRDGSMLYLSLPGLPSNPLGVNSAKPRENDFYLGPQLAQATYTTTVVLPDKSARVLIAPSSETFDIPGLGTITAETIQDATSVVVTRLFHLHEGLVPAERYFELVDIIERLQHPRFNTLLLEMAPQP